MQDSPAIRILEKDTNRRGDLFGRLMADLFVALGYEQPRLNIHKSGRELDLSADHRLEARRAIGECKATAESVRGDDLNKFAGVLDVEQEDKRPVAGYFISLSGFKETAIEQEKQRRQTKIVTLTGSQVIGELVEGRILIAKDRATELAGRCCSGLQSLALDSQAELLAHERGWIWCIYYTQNKGRTHFALIHSDGTPLARTLAEEVTAADQDCGGSLSKLTCLNPAPPPGSDTDPRVPDALAAYRQYLESECGYLQLDGLPADNDVGSRRLRLEHLFVPLHLDVTVGKGEEEMEIKRQPVGAILEKHPRLALLAAPGGGKSTLIKRLAIAYADSTRRAQIADDLPQKDWLPLFFRCRELRGLARGSFADLLEALSERELVRQHGVVFRAIVDRALLAGRVLLLVDGLDEISDPGDRAAFVCTLRSALQAYPGVAIVVASREAGFRHVAAHLAPVCTPAVLSPFNSDDIHVLSIAWHREVVGDTEKVRRDAIQLAATIVRNDRIRSLATNPLLLTTLLLVKRWVGSLPTRRAALYGKAVEVLLMTWNTEGHEPIPDEEALPQLCYVASAMMIDGVQKISRPRLAALLQEARDSLPTELGYVKGTVDQFIHRIEDRSSLLMMTGHDIEEGLLVEFFEFRHLTFQEFLTARAMVEAWHPGRSEKDTLVAVLESHFDEEEWREVIPLAAALGGGEATEGLIQRLTERVRTEVKDRWDAKEDSLFLALVHCLADEVAARPDIIRAALREVVRCWQSLENSTFQRLLTQGRYGTDLWDEARKAFLAPTTYLGNAAWALMYAVWWRTVRTENASGFEQAGKRLLDMLNSPERLSRCEGALACERLCFVLRKRERQAERRACIELLRLAGAALVPMVFSEHKAEQYAAIWALVWLGACRLWAPPGEPDVIGQLFKLWRHAPDKDIHSLAEWALASQPLLPFDARDWRTSFPASELDGLFQGYDDLKDRYGKPAALVVAWYLRAPWNDEELAQRARGLLEGRSERDSAGHTIREILMACEEGIFLKARGS